MSKRTAGIIVVGAAAICAFAVAEPNRPEPATRPVVARMTNAQTDSPCVLREMLHTGCVADTTAASVSPRPNR